MPYDVCIHQKNSALEMCGLCERARAEKAEAEVSTLAEMNKAAHVIRDKHRLACLAAEAQVAALRGALQKAKDEIERLAEGVCYDRCWEKDCTCVEDASAEVVEALALSPTELSKAVELAVSALKWEEKRCGRLYGPLSEALTALRKAGWP